MITPARFVCGRCMSYVCRAKPDGEPFCPKCGLWMRDVWHGETPEQKRRVADAIAAHKQAHLAGHAVALPESFRSQMQPSHQCEHVNRNPHTQRCVSCGEPLSVISIPPPETW